jgi:hypothetical protein
MNWKDGLRSMSKTSKRDDVFGFGVLVGMTLTTLVFIIIKLVEEHV